MISSRSLLFALVGLNLLVLLILTGVLPGAGSDERDPARLDRQVAPDKLERTRPSVAPSSPLPDGADSGAVIPPVAGVSVSAENDSSAPPGREPAALARQGQADTGGVPGLGAAAGQLAREAGAPVTGVASLSTSTSLRTDFTESTNATSPGAAQSREAEALNALATRENCVLFPETDYLSARRQIEQFAPSLARTSLKRLDAGSYLVFLDPLLSKEAAEQRRDELVAVGLSTAQVITSGLLKNGVQLGLVRTALAAESRRLELLEQGIDQAHVGPLSVTTSRYQARMWADTALIEQSIRPAARQAGLTLEPCE